MKKKNSASVEGGDEGNSESSGSASFSIGAHAKSESEDLVAAATAVTEDGTPLQSVQEEESKETTALIEAIADFGDEEEIKAAEGMLPVDDFGADLHFDIENDQNDIPEEAVAVAVAKAVADN